MRSIDALRSVELGRVLHEASSPLRHDLRNRLGSIRNMAYFVAKRVRGCEAATQDPRVLEFLAAIEQEVEKANRLIDSWGEQLNHVHERDAAPVPARRVVELAADSARIDSAIELHVTCEDHELEVDPLEMALALRCLIENAAEAGGNGRIEVIASPKGEGYSLLVRDHGPGFDPASGLAPQPPPRRGHLGVGLAIAKRSAEGAGGKLVVTRGAGGGSEVELVLPLHARAEQGVEATHAAR